MGELTKCKDEFDDIDSRLEKLKAIKNPCPHCQKELKIPPAALMNSDIYSRSCITVTDCCGKGVTVRPIRKYDISVYTGIGTEDDWGREIKK